MEVCVNTGRVAESIADPEKTSTMNTLIADGGFYGMQTFDQHLVALIRETGKVGGVAYNLRYYPLCQEARALVENGAIGQPKLVHGSFLQDWLLYPSDWNWRLDPKLGGQLLVGTDFGVYASTSRASMSALDWRVRGTATPRRSQRS